MLGEDVLVTGAGPIGIIAAMVSKHAGARHVVITDHSDERLALASKLGVTRAVNIDRENVADAQLELGMREGFDVGLEMSGSSAALRDMITQMTHGGRIADTRPAVGRDQRGCCRHRAEDADYQGHLRA